MSRKTPHINLAIKLLALSSFFIFLGRGYQLLWWDAPWRVFLWDQKLLEPIISRLFGTTWEDYAANLTTSHFISNASRGLGLFMILSGVVSLFLLKFQKKWMYILVFISSLILLINTFLGTIEQFGQWGHFFENSIQIVAPIAFVIYLQNRISREVLLRLLKILVVVTFFSHGLYAVGYYPVPGSFLDMIIMTFGVSEDFARHLLQVVGYLDLLLVPFLFYKPVFKWVILYATIWGFITAFGRITSHYNVAFPLSSLHQYAYLVVYRFAHGLIPLVILKLQRK